MLVAVDSGQGEGGVLPGKVPEREGPGDDLPGIVHGRIVVMGLCRYPHACLCEQCLVLRKQILFDFSAW